MQVEGVDIRIGGTFKLDVLYSRFSDADVPSQDAGRDYFRPNSIPVVRPGEGADPHHFLDFHARDSRFYLAADTSIGGATVGGYVETDFRSSVGGATEVNTNAYNPRLRRVFLTWDRWLFGQEWTLFRTLEAAPDHIDDLLGPTQAMTVVRQPQIRYRGENWQVALENAETNVQPRVGTESIDGSAITSPFVTGDSRLPDLTLHYRIKLASADLGIATVFRQLLADDAAADGAIPGAAADDAAFGYGAQLAGKQTFSSGDDLRFSISGGTGIGRYLALATAADAVVTADGALKAIPVAAAFVSYRHRWNPLWRSTITVATFVAGNDAALAAESTTKSVHSAHVNALYSPVDRVTMGIEFMHAVREVENGETAALSRLQFSAKYEF